MPRILSIQYLRGAAALMVVFFHANGMALEYFNFDWSPFGAAGVDIFFVISGFIMWITTAAERTTPASFIVSRIVRVVPLYWAVTLLLYGGWLFFRDPATLPSIWNLLRSLLFIPFVSPRTGEIQPLLIAGWTLNFEMFFYAVFACGLFLCRRHRALFVCTVLGALVTLGLWSHPSGPIGLTFTSPLLIEFMFGCLLGVIYERKAAPRAAIALFLLIVGFGQLLNAETLSAADLSSGRFFNWGLPAFLIVTGALGLEPLLKHLRVPALLGDASYSIYLTHGLALAMVKNVFLLLGASSGSAAMSVFTLTGCVASVLIGIAVFHFVEKPLTAGCRNLIAKLPHKPAIAALPVV